MSKRRYVVKPLRQKPFLYLDRLLRLKRFYPSKTITARANICRISTDSRW
jgi:hypothetical protein